jgi:hypothetical protein
MRTSTVKRAVLGAPIASAQEMHHRLPKTLALSVFSSDAISSTAYATEKILLVLMIAGTASVKWASPLSVAVAGLLAIVAVSYQQTEHAYPSGGGSYIVSAANLGRRPGMLAASSLMIDSVGLVATAVRHGRSLRPGPQHSVVVIIPELLVEHRWQNLLHNQTSLRLKAALLHIPWVVTMNVPLPACGYGPTRRKSTYPRSTSTPVNSTRTRCPTSRPL